MKRLLALLLLVAFAVEAEAQSTKFVSASPTVDTSIYASGDLIGGKLTFSEALRLNANTGYVVSVMIADKAAQASDLDLVLFSADPSTTTFTDQAAFDVADADLDKVLGVVSLTSSSRFAYVDNGVKFVGSLLIPIRGISGTAPTRTVYGALISRGTPTFAAGTDVKVTLGISQD